MSFFSALVVDGILAGSIYALIALAFVVVYEAARIINFALGECAMLGALIRGGGTIMLGGVPRQIVLPIPRAPLEIGALQIATDRLAAAIVALVGLKVFPIVIIGGLDGIPGTIVGAMIVGVLESLAAVYLDPGFAPVAAWLVLLMVLVLRSRGLFGIRRVERV